MELLTEGEMLKGRLTYSLSVHSNTIISTPASLIIIVFTERRILENGRVKVRIPAGQISGTTRMIPGPTKPIRGHINFVPACDGSGDKRRGRA